MTNITVAVPDELAEKARAQGLLDPQRLAPLVCEVLVRATRATTEAVGGKSVANQSLAGALLSLAGAAGPGLPEDFAANHDRYLHGTPP